MIASVSALVLSGCSGGLVVPERVGLSIRGSEAGEPIPLVLSAQPFPGGGCNAGTFELETDVSEDGSGTRVVVRGHGFRSDGGECADLAEVITRIELSPVAVGGTATVTVELGGQVNEFVIERAVGYLVVTAVVAPNVDSCQLEPVDCRVAVP